MDQTTQRGMPTSYVKKDGTTLLGVLGLSMSTMYFASAYYCLKGHNV